MIGIRYRVMRSYVLKACAAVANGLSGWFEKPGHSQQTCCFFSSLAAAFVISVLHQNPFAEFFPQGYSHALIYMCVCADGLIPLSPSGLTLFILQELSWHVWWLDAHTRCQSGHVQIFNNTHSIFAGPGICLGREKHC